MNENTTVYRLYAIGRLNENDDDSIFYATNDREGMPIFVQGMDSLLDSVTMKFVKRGNAESYLDRLNIEGYSIISITSDDAGNVVASDES